MDSPDSIPMTLAPTNDEMLSFAFAHLADHEKVMAIMKRFRQLDKLALGRWEAIRGGYTLTITDEEYTAAENEWKEYQALRGEVLKGSRFGR